MTPKIYLNEWSDASAMKTGRPSVNNGLHWNVIIECSCFEFVKNFNSISDPSDWTEDDESQLPIGRGFEPSVWNWHTADPWHDFVMLS